MSTDNYCAVKVSGVLDSMTLNQLKEHFSECGRVTCMAFKLSENDDTAIIHFAEPAHAKTALGLNGGHLNGSRLVVVPSFAPQPKYPTEQIAHADGQSKQSESAVEWMNTYYAQSQPHTQVPPAPIKLSSYQTPTDGQAKQSESASTAERMNALYAAQSHASTQVPPAPITASPYRTNAMAAQAFKDWQNSIPLVSYTRPPPNTPKHAVTPAELAAFKADPMSLVGRQFVHERKEGDSEVSVWGERFEEEDEDEYVWFMVVSLMYGLDPHPRVGETGRKTMEIMVNYEGFMGMTALPRRDVEEMVSQSEVVDV